MSRLISSTVTLAFVSRLASFHAFIKDHKPLSGVGYPLRLIVSVIGTATKKIDWLVSIVLTRLVTFVLSHVRNTIDIDLFSKLNLTNNDSYVTFISLDVVSLYRRISLDFGIKANVEFDERSWHSMDNLGITVN